MIKRNNNISDIILVPLRYIERTRPNRAELRPKSLLPAKAATAPRNTLVLDLDRTLICSIGSHEPQAYFVTALRPNLIPFLREMNTLFELVYWSSGPENYALSIIEAIEQAGLVLDGNPVVPNTPAFFRHHMAGSELKFLGLLNRNVHNTIIIDDCAEYVNFTPRQALVPLPFKMEPYVTPEMYRFVRELGKPKFYADVPQRESYGIGDVTAVTHDDVLIKIASLLRVVAASSHTSKELDHWRPEGYEQWDRVSMGDYFISRGGLKPGAWVNARRCNPIPPLGELYVKSFRQTVATCHIGHDGTPQSNREMMGEPEPY